MPARISVVVPIYNVAAYLQTCLESLEQQTFSDLQVVIVDDGSGDESPQIAEAFAARDARFQLVRQANRGLGGARNTGVDHSSGDFIAFVDGDDVLPRRALEVLVGALDRTGSDFASGNVRRLTSSGTKRAGFLGDAFERTRLQTHIANSPDLLTDRIACNKLFRRAFWEEHKLRFPEGVFYEDIPVILRAHYLARSVDVLRETVYLWRRREGGDLSITQRRTEAKGLRDRVAAVDSVSRFLSDRGWTEAKRLYDESAVANDLRYFLNVLSLANDDYRELFLELVNDFLDRADPRVLDQPLAIERLKWHLVRRRALPELLEVLLFQDEDLAAARPVRRLRTWYGDYPFRTDRRLRIPRKVYRLVEELAPVVRLNDLRWEGDELRIEGYAYIDLLGAPRPGSQKVELVVRRGGRRQRQVRVRAHAVHRPDVTADADQELVSLDWSGFAATIRPNQLQRGRRWRMGNWRIGIVVRAGGVTRTSWAPKPAPLHRLPVAETSGGDAPVRAELDSKGMLSVRVQRNRSTVRSYAVEEGTLELAGAVGPVAGNSLDLQVSRRDGTASLAYAAEVDRSGKRPAFVARVPLADLVHEIGVADRASHDEQHGGGVAWDIHLVGDGRPSRLALHEGADESTWTLGGREMSLQRTRYGHVSIVERVFRPVVTGAEWSPAGALSLTGSFRGPPGVYDLVLADRQGSETQVFPLQHDAEAGRFEAELTPAAVVSFGAARSLSEGQWELRVCSRDDARDGGVAAVLDHALLDELPLSAEIDRRSLRVGVVGYDIPVVAVERDLDEDERGGYRQRQLRTELYPSRRGEELREAVVYECFGGTGYCDSPRAIHEELLRRGAQLQHLWVVRDAAFAVPETATALRQGTREYYEAFASARYVVTNDYWPHWFRRRPDQICLQTWHGAPLKRHGHALADRPRSLRALRLVQRRPAEQHVVSPAPFATPILQRSFSVEGEVLETGLPRTDVLLRPDRDLLAADVRRRLGVGDKRVILYAPTYRDHLVLGGDHRYRLGPLLDLVALRSALGDEDVLLFRRHRSMAGALPRDAESAVLDVSEFPDATELLLAADVLVTDYSSAIFDFASTGRPIAFFTPDLEVYRDEIRGFSIDFEAVAPGPLLSSTHEVIEALRGPDALRTAYGERYERFVSTYCPLNDGAASKRVADAVFLR